METAEGTIEVVDATALVKFSKDGKELVDGLEDSLLFLQDTKRFIPEISQFALGEIMGIIKYGVQGHKIELDYLKKLSNEKDKRISALESALTAATAATDFAKKQSDQKDRRIAELERELAPKEYTCAKCKNTFTKTGPRLKVSADKICCISCRNKASPSQQQ